MENAAIFGLTDRTVYTTTNMAIAMSLAMCVAKSSSLNLAGLRHLGEGAVVRVAWGIRTGASLWCDVLGYGREPGSCYGRASHLFNIFSGVF